LCIVCNCRCFDCSHSFSHKNGGNENYNESTYVYNVEDQLPYYFDETLPNGTLEFTHSVLNSENFSRIIPLGNINPPGHTYPSDHIYWVLTSSVERYAVYAPTGGKVYYIGEPGIYGDCDIRIAVTNTMTYYIGHIFIDDNIEVGDVVLAGDQIGTSGNTDCVDFGVLNKNATNELLSGYYPVVSLYADKPLSYYAEPLKSELYSLVKPPQPIGDPDYVYDGEVTDGKFVYDIAGTLRGNWFKENNMPSSWYEWTTALSFSYDNFYTDQIRITIGTTSTPYVLNNNDSPIKPEDVSVSSGAVAYYIYNGNNTNKGIPTGTRTGLMMVQMLSDSRIELEIFDDTTSTSRAFTSSAVYYIR
jgi:hypothetical protein